MSKTYFEKWQIFRVGLDEDDEREEEKLTVVFFKDEDDIECCDEWFSEDCYQALKDLEGETVNVECLHVDDSGEKLFLNFVDKLPTEPKEVSLSQILAKKRVKVDFT
jgi:hypothetical protein